MRGKGCLAAGPWRGSGITPAHAGKRQEKTGCWDANGDHPRTCGEKMRLNHSITAAWGSPPHMRGKVLSAPTVTLPSGITPAHAGKSNRIMVDCACLWDHPRTCGEKHLLSTLHLLRPGSPPHMRGKVTFRMDADGVTRITPAHAGKRTALSPRWQTFRDHPRTCGEKYK